MPPQAASSVPGSSASSSRVTASGLDEEAEDQLEMELCWCIQQLQTSLDSGKLNERQTLDTSKTLKVLTSKNAPLIKKRQFMRTTFGDYRSKMAQDEKKLGKNSSQVKFGDSNGTSGSKNAATVNVLKKSVFLKKATVVEAKNGNMDIGETLDSNTQTSNFRILPTGDSFKFNFHLEPETSDPDL